MKAFFSYFVWGGIDWQGLGWCIFDRYEKAIKIYEEIACQSLNNNLLKYGVKGHLLNAGMCHLCKPDVVSITNALEKYQVFFFFLFFPPKTPVTSAYTDVDFEGTITWFLTPTFLQDLDPTFTGTRECKFLSVRLETEFCSDHANIAYIKYA